MVRQAYLLNMHPNWIQQNNKMSRETFIRELTAATSAEQKAALVAESIIDDLHQPLAKISFKKLNLTVPLTTLSFTKMRPLQRCTCELSGT